MSGIFQTLIMGKKRELIGSTTQGTTGATTLAVAYPTGLQAGDLLVIIAASNSTVTYTATGFTAALNGGTTMGFVASKVADGTETGSITVSCSSAVAWSAHMLLIRNASTLTIGSTGSNSAVLPTIAAGVQATGFAFYGIGSQLITFSTPSGYAAVANRSVAGNSSTAVFQKEVTSADSGASVATTPSGGTSTGVGFIVR